MLAVEWQGELGGLRAEIDDLRAENQGLAAQIAAKQRAMDTREAQCAAQVGVAGGREGRPCVLA